MSSKIAAATFFVLFRQCQAIAQTFSVKSANIRSVYSLGTLLIRNLLRELGVENRSVKGDITR